MGERSKQVQKQRLTKPDQLRRDRSGASEREALILELSVMHAASRLSMFGSLACDTLLADSQQIQDRISDTERKNYSEP